MNKLKTLFDKNALWAENILKADPDFFTRLAKQQSPEYLWIGCSDSRVPANQIIGLDPGEVFVHRNVANQVIHTDLNCLSVMQYAVDVLKVKHIIVCGHYGCGGITAALNNQDVGLVTNWLRHIQDIAHEYNAELLKEMDDVDRNNKLTELNVRQQAINVGRTTIVQDAWKRGQELTVHGWVYSLKKGLLKDLNLCISNHEELAQAFQEKRR